VVIKTCLPVVLTFNCYSRHITEGALVIFKVVHVCLKSCDVIKNGQQMLIII